MNIYHLVALHARYRADHPAVIDGDRTLTYREFDRRASGFAARIAGLGVRAGDVVGLCLRDHADYLVAILGTVRLGAIVLPMDWRWTVAEQRRAAAVFSPKLVMAEPGRTTASDLPVVRLDEPWRAALPSDAPTIEAAPGGERPMLLALSSGTTGEPKGYVLTHAGYLAMCQNHWIDAGISQADRYLSVLPIAFASGRGMALATLLIGATVIMFPTLAAPEEIVAGVERFQATTTCLVPSLSRSLLRLPARPGLILPRIRLLMSIGAGLFPEEARAIRERLTPALVDIYGSSGGGLTSILRGEDMERKPGSVGRPLLGVEVEIVDHNDKPLPPRVTGRLRCRAPCMAAGFYRTPAGGDEAFRDGWFYPGDYAFLDEDGYIFLQGRTSEIIIRGGINVFAPEVERALLSCPDVIEAAVLGYPVADLGEEIAAFLICQPGTTERQLVRHLRTQLAPYKIPRQFHFVDDLPRNNTGKIVKAPLLKRLTAPA